MILAFIGTAGSGKTTLTAEFGKYLEENGYSVSYVNLDTGVRKLPYRPDVDVRDDVTAWELMEEGLGPNGAIVRSYDLLVPKVNDYAERIRELDGRSDYVLIDTPGQMETFLFHEFGVKLMEAFPDALGVYLFSPEILRKPTDFCFALFFGLMIDLRLGITTVPALSKIDTASVDELRKYLDDVEYLTARLKLEPSTQGLLAYKLCSTLPELAPPTRVLYLSAKTREGFDELETVAYEHYCTCGDLT
ncbi:MULTISPECIES: ATP/GTP-binding protein [Thermococcus]|uniref:GTPase SAR1-related small G protein n=1 Tax=Thermococcus nautili TaxID=195522 RepID=W8P123_9EURY|nr:MULTISPECIES: ATP/GTP-binding protein [Thermococcus]AHL22436.1 GTPase SAR1-related small G protein [Thermococcus nautili]NJE48314.1 GTPase [Thermococcus sp. 9N3]CAI1493517.1 GTPase SAR1-related small G protein [Thermococcus nautili]